MTLSGLMMAGPIGFDLLQNGQGRMESMPSGTVAILVVGALVAVVWQIGRNAKNLLGSKELQDKVASKLEVAMEAKKEEDLRKAQAGIEPE